MNRTWLCSILIISFSLFCLLKSQKMNSLAQYFRGGKVIKLQNFEDAKKKVSKEDLHLLNLWESIMTGRSASLSKIVKERYRVLGMNHIFTPSGFHLSAALFPFLRLIKSHRHKLYLLLTVGVGLFFLPGLAALKRMLLVKASQNILGTHSGFFVAILLDVLWGSFQTGALGFSYSFLFLGIIYSGLKGIGLIIWFFLAQIILALFQGNDVSPLLLLFSPILNFSFSLIMPIIFLLAIPLWDWQLKLGIFILNLVQDLVDVFASLSIGMPRFEVHIVVILLLLCLLMKKWRPILIIMLFMSNSLNLDRSTQPGLPSNDFTPQGRIVKRIYREKDVRIYFSDGRCSMKLVRGYWWENCSPSKRGSKNKKIKKLSYPS